MTDLLFKKVKCKGYITKCDRYISIDKNSDSEFYCNSNDGKQMPFEEGFKQELKKIKKLKFEGFCVGVTRQAMSIYLDVEYDHPYCKPYVVTEKQDYIDVARIYYANNKSRLVPVNLIEVEED